jgi:hypothetical protein
VQQRQRARLWLLFFMGVVGLGLALAQELMWFGIKILIVMSASYWMSFGLGYQDMLRCVCFPCFLTPLFCKAMAHAHGLGGHFRLLPPRTVWPSAPSVAPALGRGHPHWDHLREHDHLLFPGKETPPMSSITVVETGPETCLYCGKRFDPMECVGLWQCWFHPQPDMSCCGMDSRRIRSGPFASAWPVYEDLLGCTRCDHTAEPWTSADQASALHLAYRSSGLDHGHRRPGWATLVTTRAQAEEVVKEHVYDAIVHPV